MAAKEDPGPTVGVGEPNAIEVSAIGPAPADDIGGYGGSSPREATAGYGGSSPREATAGFPGASPRNMTATARFGTPLTLPKVPGPGTLCLRAFRCWLLTYRRTWRSSVWSSVLGPLFYLAAMGYGLGSLVEKNGTAALGGVPYAVFVAPALLAAHAMNTGMATSLWPVFGATRWNALYLAARATTLRPADIYRGHLLFNAMRIAMNSACFVVVMAAFGLIRSPWAVLLAPAAVLTGFAFAAPAAAWAITLEHETSLNYPIRFVAIPLMLFSGTFFPVSQLPGWIRPLAYATPLWHGVALCRELSIGDVGLGSAVIHVGYLVALSAVGLWACGRTYTRRLYGLPPGKPGGPVQKGGTGGPVQRGAGGVGARSLPVRPELGRPAGEQGMTSVSRNRYDRSFSFASLPGARGLRLIERHARLYRRLWLLVLAEAAEPLFYLLSVGVGIGALIGTVTGPGGQPVPYREFVAPGLLAVSALNGALGESTFNIYARLKFAKLYEAVMATPLGARDVAFAEIGWAVLRGVIYSATFLVVIAALGLVESPWALLALPGAALISFATAAVGVYLTTFMKTWQDFDYILLVSAPLFLFSGTFYPLSVYPHPVAVIVEWTPLYQGVVILRDLVLGLPSPDLAWRAAYLAALGVAGLALAGQRIAKLLLV